MHPRSSLAPTAMRTDASARLGRLRACVLALLSFSLASPIFAQSTSGSLSGRVTNPSNAVVVNARVVAVGADTNGRYETATNATGDYVLTNLPPAAYRIVTDTAFNDQGQFSVNGQRADANYFTVDGVSANFGVTPYFPMV